MVQTKINVISQSQITSIGTITITETNRAISGLSFGEVTTPTTTSQSPLLEEASRQLHQYLNGNLRKFDLPLNPVGTAFMQSVWQALFDIPFGETKSYKDIAQAINSPRASRAVGLANNRNPIPIFIPCHRVIGVNGDLVGYGGGLPIKQALLALEGSI